MTQAIEFAKKVTLQKGGNFDEIEIRQVPRDCAIGDAANGDVDIYFDALTEQPSIPEELSYVKALSQFVSVVFNPAPGRSNINPFSIKRFRQFAMYSLLDRERIATDLSSALNAETQPLWLDFSDFNPDYEIVKSIIGEHRSHYEKYDVTEASSLMRKAVVEVGADFVDGKLIFDKRQICVTVFVREDNPLLKAIAQDFVARLQSVGVGCNIHHGSLGEWKNVAYGSDPGLHKWHVGFESSAYSGNVRYEVDAKFCYTYGPWAGGLPPNLRQPGWWRYENQQLDGLTRRLYGGEYSTMEERREIIMGIAAHALDEAVRGLVLVVKGLFVYNPAKDSSDPISDPYVGPRTYFWAHTISPSVLTTSKRLVIGVSRTHSSAYNKVAGFTDSASMCIYNAVHDHGVFAHPLSGLWTSYRYQWDLVNDGPKSKYDVPADALTYGPSTDEFEEVGPDKTCISRVKIRYLFGKWHHGESQNMNDVLHFLYFMFKWSRRTGIDDRRYDPWWASMNSEIVKRVVGFDILDDKSIELYLNYWHPERSEIACWINCWPWHPWELLSLSESVVEKQLAAFSLAAAEDSGLPMLDLTKEPTLGILDSELDSAMKAEFIPHSLRPFVEPREAAKRYRALRSWVDEHQHYLVMAGPYFFEGIDNKTGSETLRSIRFLNDNVAQSYPIDSNDIRKL